MFLKKAGTRRIASVNAGRVIAAGLGIAVILAAILVVAGCSKSPKSMAERYFELDQKGKENFTDADAKDWGEIVDTVNGWEAGNPAEDEFFKVLNDKRIKAVESIIEKLAKEGSTAEAEEVKELLLSDDLTWSETLEEAKTIEQAAADKREAENAYKLGKTSPESDFEVGLTDDGKGVVIKKYVGNGGKVVIPATIQGMPVREIGGKAFGFKDNSWGEWRYTDRKVIQTSTDEEVDNPDYRPGYSAITSVTIPDGVTTIGGRAFCWRDCLKTIVIPPGVKEMGWDAFRGTGLTAVTIYAGMKYSGLCYADCKALTSVIIQDGVTVIPEDMFYYCSALKTISIPDSVKEIGSGAFGHCSGLTSVVFSPDIKRKWDSCFFGCKKLDLASQSALKKAGYTGSF